MLKSLIAGAVALGSVTAANAATVIEIPFGTNPYTVVTTYDFNDPADDGLVTGSGYQFLTPPTTTAGAVIAGGDNTRYLAVQGGGSATISFAFADLVNGFALDIGSVDTFNELRIDYAGGGFDLLTGSDFATPANGDQSSPLTNGRFFVSGEGRQITGITLTSGANSFEVDNLTTSVPEPATWGMMILGFGVVGAAMRRRRSSTSHVLA